MQDIRELDLAELQDVLKGWGQPAFAARQIFSWIYQKGAGDFTRMSDLPLPLRQRLKEKFSLSALKAVSSLKSKDSTVKILFELDDKNFIPTPRENLRGSGFRPSEKSQACYIEAVIIPSANRVTGCISTQAGCRFCCAFCASGLGGFKRDLTTAEMLSEVLYLKDKSRGKLTHLVFMGTGEPLDNYDNVIKAIRIINSREGLNIGARRITISTCGVIPGIKKLAQVGLQIELSVSLHAADDQTRLRLMPVNKIYPLKELLRACREYIRDTGRQVTFEYVLIKGLNSDLPNALDLSKILKGLNCKVNLIPANPIREQKIAPPDKHRILLFRDYLCKAGINVTLRRPRGGDIEAACGQLKLRYEKN